MRKLLGRLRRCRGGTLAPRRKETQMAKWHIAMTEAPAASRHSSTTGGPRRSPTRLRTRGRVRRLSTSPIWPSPCTRVPSAVRHPPRNRLRPWPPERKPLDLHDHLGEDRVRGAQTAQNPRRRLHETAGKGDQRACRGSRTPSKQQTRRHEPAAPTGRRLPVHVRDRRWHRRDQDPYGRQHSSLTDSAGNHPRREAAPGIPCHPQVINRFGCSRIAATSARTFEPSSPSTRRWSKDRARVVT